MAESAFAEYRRDGCFGVGDTSFDQAQADTLWEEQAVNDVASRRRAVVLPGLRGGHANGVSNRGMLAGAKN